MSRGIFTEKIEKTKEHFGKNVETVNIEKRQVTVLKRDAMTSISWKATLKDNLMFELMNLFMDIKTKGDFTLKGMTGPFLKFVFRLAKKVLLG